MADQIPIWAKDTAQSESNPLYVDLFDEVRSRSDYKENVTEQQESDAEKNDALATQYHLRGNDLMERNDFEGAIEYFNKCVCFAENRLTASLAYANRGICFLNLNLFNECLIDVELAVNAGYPADMLPKLHEQRTVCLEKMENIPPRRPFKPQLSFEADKTVHCLAKIVLLARDETFGRHLVTRSDIEVDQTVLVEEPLAKILNGSSKHRRCNACLKKFVNLIPCKRCTSALFCRGTCSIKARYHKFECNMKFGKIFKGPSGSAPKRCAKFALRTILTLLEYFQSFDALMKYVELLRADSGVYDVISTDGTIESTLGIYINHSNVIAYESGRVKALMISSFMYDFMISHPDLQGIFSAVASRRALMHMVTHLVSVFSTNNILLQDWSANIYYTLDNDSKESYGAAIYNISTYFNAACFPNAVRLTSANQQAVVKTIRRIKNGEQIFVRYGVNPLWPTVKRQQYMMNACAFTCQCRLCLSNGPVPTETKVVWDEFERLSDELGPMVLLHIMDPDRWMAAKARFFQFLKRFDHMPLSRNIIIAYECLRMILMQELAAPARELVGPCVCDKKG